MPHRREVLPGGVAPDRTLKTELCPLTYHLTFPRCYSQRVHWPRKDSLSHESTLLIKVYSLRVGLQIKIESTYLICDCKN